MLRRLAFVREGETAGLLWSAGYFFCLLCSYYILRPLRETMGIAGGVDDLPWLWTGTLAAMLLANPLFAALVVRYPRRRFIPITYRVCLSNLVVFFLLLRLLPEERHLWVGRVFYVWTAVFSLFAVSVFWGFMADLYRHDQAKRLFGFIGAGGTLGAIAGSGTTAWLAQSVDPVLLLVPSILLLEGAVQCVLRLVKVFRLGEAGPGAPPHERADASEGGVWNGMRLVLRSRYLQLICLYLFLFTLSSTVVYFQQARIVTAALDDPGARTGLFASIDLFTNVLALALQLVVTGPLLRALGVTLTLAVLPVLSAAGFATLWTAPALVVVAVFQVMRRAADYAIAKPAREVLYTVVGRELKYKSKSFIDTFVYRGGDAIGAWGFEALARGGLGVPAIALLAVPLCLVWASVGVVLGRREASLEQQVAAHDEGPGAPQTCEAARPAPPSRQRRPGFPAG